MSSCAPNIRSFVELACTFESGGVNSLAFISADKAAVADATTSLWSTASFWETETYSGDITIFRNVSGTYSAAPVTLPGKGTQLTRNAGLTHTLVIKIDSVKGNNLFWDDFIISSDFRVAWLGNYKRTLFVNDASVRITPVMLQPEDLNSYNEWEVTIEWSSIRQAQSYNVPTGIFV